MAPRIRRGAAVAGLLAFALILAATVIQPLWNMPTTRAAPAEIASYLGDHSGALRASVLVYGLAMSAFLVFAMLLTLWLLAEDEARPAAVAVFAAGALALTALVLAGFVPMLVLAYRAPQAGSVRELYDLCFGLLAISGLPTAVAMGGYLVAVARWAGRWRITAWLAGIAGAAHVVIAGSFVPHHGFFSLEGGVIVAIPATLFVWMLATSTCLWAVRPSSARR